MAEIADCGPECTETLRGIEAFLDGEVDVGMRARIEQHLTDCAPCMGRAEFRSHLKHLVHDKCADEAVPDGVVSKIQELIREADASG